MLDFLATIIMPLIYDCDKLLQNKPKMFSLLIIVLLQDCWARSE